MPNILVGLKDVLTTGTKVRCVKAGGWGIEVGKVYTVALVRDDGLLYVHGNRYVHRVDQFVLVNNELS